MRGRLHRLPAETSEADVVRLIAELNAASDIDGILVQLPLPKQISEQKILDLVDPRKDVDGFHPINAGLLASGRPGLVPFPAGRVARPIKPPGWSLTRSAVVREWGLHTAAPETPPPTRCQ